MNFGPTSRRTGTEAGAGSEDSDKESESSKEEDHGADPRGSLDSKMPPPGSHGAEPPGGSLEAPSTGSGAALDDPLILLSPQFWPNSTLYSLSLI